MPKIRKDNNGLFFQHKHRTFRPEASTLTEGYGTYTSDCSEGDQIVSFTDDREKIIGFKTKTGKYYEYWRSHGNYIKPALGAWSPATIPPPTAGFEDVTDLLNKYRPGITGQINVIEGKWAVLCSVDWEILGANVQGIESYLKTHPLTKVQVEKQFEEMLMNTISQMEE